jgi:predicted nucleotide-binding protein
MLNKPDLIANLIQEIHELLEDKSSSLVATLQKSARLASLCNEPQLLILFEAHLDGLAPEISNAIGVRSPRQTDIEAKMSKDTLNMFFHDRGREDGKIYSHSISKLEELLVSLQQPTSQAHKLLYEDSYTQSLLVSSEIEGILSRIRNRISACVRKIERNLGANYLASKKEGTIFIGHGRSAVWRDLKDFLQDRLSLEWDEYNREPTAGMAIKERLEEMLDSASFAFLVLTAEDEHADSLLHARENVTHEVGLFQGRLGFRKAIVLLEEGCQEFSNIHGLSQIRFPKGDILAKSEEVRRVLEREGLLENN